MEANYKRLEVKAKFVLEEGISRIEVMIGFVIKYRGNFMRIAAF